MKFVIDHESVKSELGFGFINISPDEKVGFRPFELFISSIVGCSGTLLKNILVKKRITFEEINVEVEAVRNPEQANRIEKITLTANVIGGPISPKQEKDIAELVVNNCGMIQSVISSINITFIITSK